eukprot:49229-Pelagomonas_calceolata.AAC.1
MHRHKQRSLASMCKRLEKEDTAWNRSPCTSMIQHKVTTIALSVQVQPQNFSITTLTMSGQAQPQNFKRDAPGMSGIIGMPIPAIIRRCA